MGKQLINSHCNEDGYHWTMFVSDWNLLGMNNNHNAAAIKAIEFFFGKFTEASRKTMYKIMYYDGLLNGDENELGRFIIMSTIEALGKNMFEIMLKDKHYDQFLGQTGRKLKLRYFAPVHSNLETGNLHAQSVGGGHDEQALHEYFWDQTISTEQYATYMEVTNKIIKAINDDHWNGFYQFITNGWANQDVYSNLVDFPQFANRECTY